MEIDISKCFYSMTELSTKKFSVVGTKIVFVTYSISLFCVSIMAFTCVEFTFVDITSFLNLSQQNTALDVAAYFGNSCIVRVLLDRGANVANKSVFGKGCLEAAIKGSRADTCMEIIKHKR